MEQRYDWVLKIYVFWGALAYLVAGIYQFKKGRIRSSFMLWFGSLFLLSALVVSFYFKKLKS